MTTTTITATVPSVVDRGRVAAFAADVRAVARRNLIHLRRSPQYIVFSLVQTLTFLLMFRYVFGGAIPIPGLTYVDFLIPGLLASNVLFSSMGTAMGWAEDSQRGLTDRLRSLPMARTAAVLGRGVVDVGFAGFLWFAALGVGYAVGFRARGGVAGVFGALLLCLAFALAVQGLFAFVGLAVRDAEATQQALMPVFPFAFLSTAYIRVDTMPGWMQPFARNQPVSQLVDAVRGLTQGDAARHVLEHSTGHYVVTTLLWCVAIALVTAPLAIRRYARG
jgi:ABC transporter DrrB family efflux protein